MVFDSHITWELERLVGEDYELIDITVEYTYNDEYVEITDIYDSDKNEIILTDGEEKPIIDHIYENAISDYYADLADYRYEQYKDAKMERDWD